MLFQKLSTPPPPPPSPQKHTHIKGFGIPGGGVGVSGGPKILKKFCSEGSQERVFCGGGIDIFWNYIVHGYISQINCSSIQLIR